MAADIKVCVLSMLQNGEQVRVPMMRPPLVGPYAVLAQDAKGCCHLHARTAAITAAVYSLVSCFSIYLQTFAANSNALSKFHNLCELL